MTPRPTERAPTHDRAELASDLRELVRYVETLHVDPYLGYDGRTALHARAERLLRDLPERATAAEFYRLAAPLVAGLDDAHSLLRPPEDAGDARLPLSLRVVGTDLYVESVADDALTGLVGGRLRAVAGESTATLVERNQSLRGAENRYGTALLAAGAIERVDSLARLLDRDTVPESVSVAVEVDGERRSATVTPVTGQPEAVARLSRTMAHPEGSGPRFRLYEDGRAAVFDPGNLSDYRESLEAKLAAGAEVAADQAERAYRRQVGGEPPAGVEATVAALPAMTETLSALGEAMAAAGTETLFVDLRDNPGGDSQFVFHLAALLGGWEAVSRAAEGVSVVKRRSEPFRERYGEGETAAGENRANYDFSAAVGSETGEGPPPMVQQLLARSETGLSFVQRHGDGNRDTPERVVAVVSAGTMSSAFACGAQLTVLGADLVGVPPGQAPRSFGEHVEQTLSNTGLRVRLAGSLYEWVSDPDGPVLEPDRKLTPERFAGYDRAGDAGLRLAFDHAGYGASPPTPVE